MYEESTVDKDNTAMREYQGMALVLQSLDKSCMALIMDSKGPIRKNFVAAGLK
jgi:hypothetical protein